MAKLNYRWENNSWLIPEESQQKAQNISSESHNIARCQLLIFCPLPTQPSSILIPALRLPRSSQTHFFKNLVEKTKNK